MFQIGFVCKLTSSRIKGYIVCGHVRREFSSWQIGIHFQLSSCFVSPKLSNVLNKFTESCSLVMTTTNSVLLICNTVWNLTERKEIDMEIKLLNTNKTILLRI